ncbi:MAG: ATP-grasp domain-containing protein [Bdellovibrionales bacterium]|nr:ATP-grasp domain-containing protein [Bdellovibrionales bacterium]
MTLGNGQLGLMLGKAAKRLGIPFEAYSLPDAWNWLHEGLTEQAVVTFEQEHVNEQLLEEIRRRGIPSFPTWDSFLLLRSKLNQKRFLREQGLPTGDFTAPADWGPEAEEFLRKHGGGVIKAGKGGYDGQGVWLVDEKGQTTDGSARELWAKASEPYLEERVPFAFEAAAVAVRSHAGEALVYPTVKSIQHEGVCFQVEYTREFALSPVGREAGRIAKTIAEKLGYVGALAVEFFVMGDRVLVNEIAPRVHNSGHFTINVCAGSQFENHLRAGLGLPLLPVEPTHPAALMVNLLWPKDETDFSKLYTRLTCGREWPENVKLHWYGKSEIRPHRKMGHFTVYGKSIEECRRLGEQTLASRWVGASK